MLLIITHPEMPLMGLAFGFFFAASSAIFCRTSLSFRAVETAGRFAQDEEFSTNPPERTLCRRVRGLSTHHRTLQNIIIDIFPFQHTQAPSGRFKGCKFGLSATFAVPG